MSAIVGQLLERGHFSEVEVAPSSGGRPPVLLQLNPTAGYVVGIKLRGDGLTTVVCDLDARRRRHRRGVGRRSSATRRPRSRRSSRRPAGCCAAPGYARPKVLGVGIGLPGVIDSLRGVLPVLAPAAVARGGAAEPLQRRLRLPVWVDNDVKTLAVAEKWVG